MKKILYTILIFMLFISVTNAQGCNLISGTGKEIGDEIACGTEHFYVISNDGTNIKMLSKYNLYVGFNYELKELDKSFDTENEAADYAFELYGEEYDNLIRIYLDENNKYSSVLLYKELKEDEVKQNSEAIGAYGDEKGNPNPNQKGIISLRNGGYAVINGYSEAYGGGYYYDFTFLEGGLIEPHLTSYYNSLNKKFNIQSIDLLSVKELNNIATEVTGKELPLEQWGKDLHERTFDLSAIYVIGSIKEFIPTKYEWLWSTTYWTKTSSRDQESNNYNYFIDTLGDICAAGACVDVAGAGIRPVVTMSSNNIIYNIKTKTDGNGKLVASKEQAPSDEKIEFTVTPNEGYELVEVKVTDKEGTVITFTDNTFIMPSADVLIEASFKPKKAEVTDKEKNPETVDPIIFSCIAIIITGTLLTYFNIKKIKETL